MVMPVMAEDIATNQFVIPTTMPPLEPCIENPTFTVTDAPDSVVSSVKDGMENLPVYDPNNDTAPKEYLMIVEPHHKFQEPLKVRPETDGIVIHHVAIPSGDISSQAIHKAHLKNGWAGIGYHFVIRKDGTIERGRPLSVVGTHAQGDNLHTIGICMAGNFEKEYVGLSNIMHL
ncbi:N-acetylmuramoyl-L-alanine amidase [Veillonella sp. YH-vei2232]|uniref:N-acetylmuramoyl-L-alanine amidase n=1 Tax=Veillonella absiana TaxID=3079305 RepID=A0ABU3Z6N6_9FIRM|nr:MULTISPECIES: N-acetylmuramoyl-L-alanine amidase [unclassified Veillonella]MDV5063356.1 N-acetylmuramoyl-L-alanine amidase [Veillonella sp. YH-vei2232]MDV5087376.1 N-acetylmuramoyl-L-alanine amidase [Veillonella sp. YH-vei2233]